MRVTSQMMVTNSLRRLSSRLEQYEAKQEQLATGRRINRTSDDPAGSSKALTIRAALRARLQEERNAADAKTYLDSADSQLQGVVNVLQRVRDLSVAGANSLSPGELEAMAVEVSALQGQVVSIVNARVNGRPLFAGTSDADAVTGSRGAWTVNPDVGEIRRRLSDSETVTVNVTAQDLLDGGAVLTTLDDFMTALESSDHAGITASITRVDEALETVLGQLSRVGAATNRVEGSLSRATADQLTLRGELAEVEDADIEEAIMELRTEEVAYEATLGALGRSLPQSLVAFLR